MAPPAQHPVRNAPSSHSSDFLRLFNAGESQNRVAKNRRRKPLTPAQRAALRKQLQEVQFLKPNFADSTKINIAGILRKWKRYCEFGELGSWQDVIGDSDKAMAMDFLDWMCEHYKIGSEGTSWEYFRQFKQLYASYTGQYMDRNESNEVKKWHDDTLVRRHELRPANVNGKPVPDADDLLALQQFNIAYDTSIFGTERHRINLLGIYLFLGCTGVRPGEIVDNERKKPGDGSLEEVFGEMAVLAGSNDEDPEDEAPDEHSRVLAGMLSQESIARGRPKALCYEDILLMVVRHPDTGQDVLAMSVKFIHHKGADNKPKPTVFFFFQTRRLIFCLINIIVSLALADQAFDAPSLTSARAVYSVRNKGPVKCTPLRWKKEWLKRPVFRRIDGSKLSEDKALQYYKLRDDMVRQTLDGGWEKALTPRAWRRSVGNTANGSTSDAVRDQIMRHDPNWTTFYNAYLNENVEFDIQNAVLGEPREDSLLRLMTHVGIMRDPRVSKDIVPDDVWRSLPPDPEIMALEQQREMLKGGNYRIKGMDTEQEIRDLTAKIRTKTLQREKAVIAQYREYHFHKRPTWDIERQARGEVEEEYVQPTTELTIPERAELAGILCNQPADMNSEDLLQSRIRAAELMTALCHKRETVKRKRRRQEIQAEEPVKEESPPPDLFPLLMLKTQCPTCIGDERLSYEERTFPYCRPAVMNDHFDREHLQEMKELEREKLIFCDHPKCREDGVKLKHLDHFKAHVEKVHGVRLRPSRR